MDTVETPCLRSDEQVLLEHLTTGKAIAPEVYRRIRERAEAITNELRQVHGEMTIAVDLIRETRDEE